MVFEFAESITKNRPEPISHARNFERNFMIQPHMDAQHEQVASRSKPNYQTARGDGGLLAPSHARVANEDTAAITVKSH